MVTNHFHFNIIPQMNKTSSFFLKSISCLLIIFTIPLAVAAQMFSIDDTEPRRERILGSTTIVGLSWELGNFSYQGDEAEPLQRVDFNDSILRVRMESPGLDISLGFGGALTGMDETSYFNINARIYNHFSLKRERSHHISLPIQLTTDLKQARRNESDAEFQQSSLIFGTGLAGAIQATERLSLHAKATPNYGFSFSQGNLFGGSLFRADARAVVVINDVFGSKDLSIGYHFDYRSYRIEGDLNDYDYTSHSFTIGIGF